MLKIVLTLGMFDGVHLGHLELFKALKKEAIKLGQKTGVITFKNHPSTILNPLNPTRLICTPLHKQKLIKELGIDYFIELPFTKSLSQKRAKDFLEEIYASYPFSHLVLGYDARIGHEKEGSREVVEKVASSLSAKVSYLPAFEKNGQIVSSSYIRNCIRTNDFRQASLFLGRPYTIYNKVMEGHNKGSKLGFPTANLALSTLELPIFGVYAVKVFAKARNWQGIANLGVAPTVRDNSDPLLEVHLFDCNENFYGETLEVFFQSFIRKEMKFKDLDQLKEQIAKDVQKAKGLLLSDV